jgi:hypothetical protein
VPVDESLELQAQSVLLAGLDEGGAPQLVGHEQDQQDGNRDQPPPCAAQERDLPPGP